MPRDRFIIFTFFYQVKYGFPVVGIAFYRSQIFFCNNSLKDILDPLDGYDNNIFPGFAPASLSACKTPRPSSSVGANTALKINRVLGKKLFDCFLGSQTVAVGGDAF